MLTYLLIASPASFDYRLGVRHTPSECLIPMHLGNLLLQATREGILQDFQEPVERIFERHA
jgi:hypothetical protein